MKKPLLAFAFIAVSSPTWAQNTTCATRPKGDSSNACASTAFVQNNADGPTTYNIRSYGADPTGVADSLVAIQAATTACQASPYGGIVYTPSGNYKVSGTVTNSGTKTCKFQGDTPGAGESPNDGGSAWVTSSTTADILSISSNNGAFVDSMRFDTSVTRVAGSHINIFTNNTANQITNIALHGYYIGIQLMANNANIEHAYFYNPVPTLGVGIQVSGNEGCVLLNDIQMLPPLLANQPAFGIYAFNSACLFISNSDIIRQGVDFAAIEGNGQGASSIYVINTFFDSANVGIKLATTGTGNITRAEFVNTWSSSHTGNGIEISQSGSGVLTGITFTNHISDFNGTAGLTQSGTVSGLSINSSNFNGNTGDGINLAGTVSGISILGNYAGAYGGASGNGAAGIRIGSGMTNYNIQNNQLVGNTSASLVNASAGAIGSIIANNIGYNPVGGSAITVGASPFTYTAGASPETIYIYGGTITAIVTDALAVCNADPCTVSLQPGKNVAVTYTGLPIMVKSVH